MHNVDFLFPSCSVAFRDTPLGSFQEYTGSSVATALTAGLAALVLHCVRLGVIMKESSAHPTTLLDAADLDVIKKTSNMKTVLTPKLINSSRYGTVLKALQITLRCNWGT